MKFKVIIITIIVLFTATMTHAHAHAWSSQEWTVKYTESEMGESMTFAAVRDCDPEANAVMGISKSGDTIILMVQTYNHRPSFTEHSLEFKVDNNEILTYQAKQSDDPEGFVVISDTKLLNQLMAGNNVKVRFDTLSEGLIVVDFKLDGSMNAIAQIVGNGI